MHRHVLLNNFNAIMAHKWRLEHNFRSGVVDQVNGNEFSRICCHVPQIIITNDLNQLLNQNKEIYFEIYS